MAAPAEPTVGGVGTTAYSNTIRYEEGLPAGGVVIDTFTATDDGTGELVDRVRVVGIYRGEPRYHTLDVADCVPALGGAHINTRALRDLLLVLGRDEVRHSDPLRHLHARTVLGAVYATHSPARGARR